MNTTIKFDRFNEKKYIIIDLITVGSFAIWFIIIGLFEKNLFLPNEGLGLFEHINIWLFLTANILVPIIFSLNYKNMTNNVEQNVLDNLQNIFIQKSNNKRIKILYNLLTIIGFFFFVGNSLQNAHFINPLPFDFWDSIDFVISYMISRTYKLYLFAYFMPLAFVYAYILIISTSELLKITDAEMKEYPIKNYMQLNTLCKFGLDTLMIVIIPILLFSGGIYLVHDRLDITTISTIIITVLSIWGLLSLYILLSSKFYVSVIKYKKNHIMQIDSALSDIHQAILNIEVVENDSNKLELYLQKQDYLWNCREKIEKISELPLVVKAIITIITPLIPTLLKFLFLALENFL